MKENLRCPFHHVDLRKVSPELRQELYAIVTAPRKFDPENVTFEEVHFLLPERTSCLPQVVISETLAEVERRLAVATT